MTLSTRNAIRTLAAACLALVAGRSLAVAAVLGISKDHHRRQVTFKLTFANDDVIWLGDPASPATSMYLKPGVMPIATDVCVTTVSERQVSPARRYFREARVAEVDGTHTVFAFTREREKIIGTLGADGRFTPDPAYKDLAARLPSWPQDASALQYDKEENALYAAVNVPGPVASETLDFLPLVLTGSRGTSAGGTFSIQYAPPAGEGMYRKPGTVELLRHGGRGKPLALAKAETPGVFQAADVQLGSFDNTLGTYLAESVYRPAGDVPAGAKPSVTVTVPGEFTWVINARAEDLVFTGGASVRKGEDDAPTVPIRIDGNFDDWRNVAGMDDPRGDLVPYLDYVPDVDILEFKVAHDAQHIYLYVRVAGQVGRTHPARGRSRLSVYMDVDRNAETGVLPTRDDDGAFGVDIGADCEVQLEFENQTFHRSFYSFCGLGGAANVLKQQVALGKSGSGKRDEAGAERPDRKVDYVFRDGKTAIPSDRKADTSDSITFAISPDGREVEVGSTLEAFLRDAQGKPVVSFGQSIDLAVALGCESKGFADRDRRGADSSAVIRGYTLGPAPTRTASIKKARK